MKAGAQGSSASAASGRLACPPLTFVLAEPAHIPGICAIERLCFATPWSEDAFRKEFEDDLARYYVAIAPNGFVVGYCGYWSVAGEAHITNVAVHPEWQRRGVGRALVRRLLDDAAARGIRDVTLEVREDNRPALALYERFGFERCGMRKNYYQKEKKNAIIMWNLIQ